MCDVCWVGYGSPRIEGPKIEVGIVHVQQVYAAKGGSMGGGLHVVLDDWNIEDESIESALKEDLDSSTLTFTEVQCARYLLTLTLAERASVLKRVG